MFYVYILKCRDGSFYTGYTNDIENRLKLHNEGRASKYTRSRLPVALVKQWKFATKSQAMKHEAAIKKLTKKEKISTLAIYKEYHSL